ncbi:MAG TPA: hypothetical protein VMS65_16475 [Polyangiaceae bacterium]|nr:hypothetical protein [Polyangiaceae bacterium]
MKSKSIVSKVFSCGALVGIAYACSGSPDAVLRPHGDDGEAGEGASSGRGGASNTGGIIVTRGGSTGKGGKGGSAAGTGDGGDNGQGGIRDAGLPDVGFEYDASSGGEGGACAVVTGDATLVKRPMDIVISIDNSGSMAGEINAVIARINTDFAQIIEASGIDYRVIMVSRYGHLNYTLGETNYSVCIGPPLGNAACTQPNGPTPALVNRPPRFYHHSTDIGSRNMWCRLTTSYTTRDEVPQSRAGWAPVANCVGEPTGCVPGWRHWLRPNAFKVFIGITDDAPGTNSGGTNQLCTTASGFTDNLSGAQSFDRAIRTLDPAQFGAYDAMNPDMGRNYRWYSIVGMAPKAGNARTTPYAANEAVVTTICQGPVGGAGGDDDGVAAGVGYQELSRMTGGLRYSNCLNDDFDAIFNAIAQGVIDGARASCEYDVPSTGNGIIDPNQTTVRYRAGGVGAGTELTRVGSTTACGAAGGYYFSSDLRKIFLCPAACTTVQADPMARIAIDFGCLGS